jgi:hypothetical protein
MTTSDEIATEAFETYRPLLFSIAYRMLGSAFDIISQHIQSIRSVMNPDKLAYMSGQLQAR